MLFLQANFQSFFLVLLILFILTRLHEQLLFVMQKDPAFYKFPKTPHLVGSSTVDDDQILSKSDLKALAGGTHVIVQEKVDGNFFSIVIIS